jgi:transposase-like protein
MKIEKQPQTLMEAIQYFANEAVCVEYLCNLHYDLAKPVCPHCGSLNITGLKTRPKFQCREKGCRKQFSMKRGTVMEDSPIPITKWMPCMWLIANDKNGISSCELARALGVTQKTAWFMLHRVRVTMEANPLQKMSGAVEIDETYVGGKGQHMSPARKAKAGIESGRGISNKTVVMGIVQRGGSVYGKVVESAKRKYLMPEIFEKIEEGSDVYTDALRSYDHLHQRYNHKTVDHAKQFVDGEAHTNTLENFWCLLKRSLKGTYVQVAPEHLDAYVTEQAFRYNERKKNDAQRFAKVASSIFGKRLTYKELIGQVAA